MRAYIYEWLFYEHDYPIVLGFGKTEDGSTVCLTYKEYRYSCYIDDVTPYPEKKKFLRDNGRGERTFYRVFFETSQELVKYASKRSIRGESVWEHDIDPLIKFMAEANVSHCEWLEGDWNETPFENRVSTCDLEYEVTLNDLNPCIYLTILPDFVVLSIDAEVYSSVTGCMPNTERMSDEVFMLSLVVKTYKKDDKKNYLLYVSDEDMTLNVKDVTCKRYTSEAALLESFYDHIGIIDPDIVIGFNTFGFDFPYMYKRHMGPFNNCTRYKKGMVDPVKVQWESSAFGKNEFFFFDMPGRIFFDLITYMRKEYTTMRQYTLNSTAEAILKRTKIDLSADEMFKLRDINTSASMSRIAEYCVVDSDLTLDLFEAVHGMETLTQCAKILKVSMQALYTDGQQKKIMASLYIECHKQRLFDCNMTEKENYGGGLVFDPIQGFHEGCFILDFASLYPSIMISKNICYTTARYDVHTTTSIDPVFDTKVEQTRISNQTIYQGAEDPDYPAVIPNMLKKLLSERKQTKTMMKSTSNPLEKMILDKRQWGLKISANSIYGVLGAHHRYLSFPYAAELVTATGQSLLRKAKELIEGYPHRSLSVVYGDTDSCIVKVDGTLQECETVGKEVCAYVNKIFFDTVHPCIKMEYEHTFSKILLIKKKNYIAKIEGNDMLLYKGVTAVRKDNFMFLARTYRDVIDLIFMRDATRDDVDNYLHARRKLMYSAPMDEFIKRAPYKGTYKSDTHPQRIYVDYLIRTKTLNYPPTPGSRLDFVYVVPDNCNETLASKLLKGELMRHPDALHGCTLYYDLYWQQIEKKLGDVLRLMTK